MHSLSKKIAPDLKGQFLNEVPSLPKLLIFIPVVVYLSIIAVAGYLGYYWYVVKGLERQYPLDVAEVERLESSIDLHKTEITKQENYYKTFLKWRAWYNESQPLSPVVASILQAVAKDVRINYLDLKKSEDGPNQLKLTLRIALTTTAATKQFDSIIGALEQDGYAVAGGIDESVDSDGANKYPTPNGNPPEVFHRLDVTFVDKHALAPLKHQPASTAAPTPTH